MCDFIQDKLASDNDSNDLEDRRERRRRRKRQSGADLRLTSMTAATTHHLLNNRNRPQSAPLNEMIKRQSNDTYGSSHFNSERTSKLALNLDEN